MMNNTRTERMPLEHIPAIDDAGIYDARLAASIQRFLNTQTKPAFGAIEQALMNAAVCPGTLLTMLATLHAQQPAACEVLLSKYQKRTGLRIRIDRPIDDVERSAANADKPSRQDTTSQRLMPDRVASD